MKFHSRPDFAAIGRPAFGQAAQTLPSTPHRSKAAARYERQAQTAYEAVQELPRPGESLHIILTGYFDCMQLISATVKRLPQCRRLRLATLCYSKRNVQEITAILEAHPGMSFSLLCSEFFKNHNREIFEYTAEQLRGYPSTRLVAARSHCKIALIDVDDQTGIAIEGSANLRTNRNREQICIINDRPLHDWHARWIDELVRTDGKQPRKTRA